MHDSTSRNLCALDRGQCDVRGGQRGGLRFKMALRGVLRDAQWQRPPIDSPYHTRVHDWFAHPTQTELGRLAPLVPRGRQIVKAQVSEQQRLTVSLRSPLENIGSFTSRLSPPGRGAHAT
jgi:hypothetical protein